MAHSQAFTLQTVQAILLRCWVGGFSLLIFGLLLTQFMGQTIYKIHSTLFGLTSHELDVVFYCAFGILKLLVLILFFIPWLAILSLPDPDAGLTKQS